MSISLFSRIAKGISYIIFGEGLKQKPDEQTQEDSTSNAKVIDTTSSEIATPSEAATKSSDLATTSETATSSKTVTSNETDAKSETATTSIEDEILATAKALLSNVEKPKVITAETIDETGTFESFKGMEEQIQFLRRNLLFPIVNEKVLLECGVKAIRGIIFYGDEQSEHSLLVKTLTNELSRISGKKYSFFQRSKKDVLPKYGTDGEKYIKSLFDEVMANLPSVVFLEDIHTLYHYCSILGPRNEIVHALTTEMSRNKSSELVVIASIDTLEKMAPSLLRPGYFEKAVKFGSPSHKRRKSILEMHSSKWNPRPSEEILEEMAKKTPDFSLENLEKLCSQSFLLAIQRKLDAVEKERCHHCKSCDNSLKLNEHLLETVEVLPEDWDSAFTDIVSQKSSTTKPSWLPKSKPVLLEEVSEKNIGFSSVGGLKEQKQSVIENIMFPMANKEALQDWGVEPVKGIIFHGPPGTGKTFLAKAVAAELSRSKDKPFTFFYHKGTDCIGSYVGETERNLREIFAKAAEKKPSILFLDEIDGICPTRKESYSNYNNSVVTTMLGLLDNVKRGEVFVIAATNRIDSLDPALRRPGRFDKTIAFFPPKEEGRQEVLKIHTAHWKRGNSTEILLEIAKQTVGYTAADLEQLCRQTFLSALKRQFPTWNQEDGKVKTDGLKDLDIILEDWYTSMKNVKGSNSSTFGNYVSTKKSVAPAVSKLLSGIVQEAIQKLQPFLTTQNQIASERETGINSFLIWDTGNQQTRIIDNFVIPCILSSPEFKDTETFTLSHDIIMKPSNFDSLISQLIRCDKTAVLLIPGVDKLGTQGSYSSGEDIRSFMNLFIEKIDSLRGENVFLLASAGCPISELPEELRFLFKGMPDSRAYKLRQLDNTECREFFSPIFQEHFPLLLDKVESLTATANLYDLLDLKAELSRACAASTEKEELAAVLIAILDQFKITKLDCFRRLHHMYS